VPTYDYECAACGHTFEEFQMISAKPLRTCPKCKKRKLQRLIGTGAAVIFKGSGFYQTDYRSSDYQAKAKAEKSESSGSSTSSDAKTDKSKTKKTPAKKDK